MVECGYVVLVIADQVGRLVSVETKYTLHKTLSVSVL